MSEATIKTRFVKRCKTALPGCEAIRHEDRYTHGVPDLSLSWNELTGWFEFKLVPFKRNKQQEHRCQRLAIVGTFCYYLIYDATYIHVVHPRYISEWRTRYEKRFVSEVELLGYIRRVLYWSPQKVRQNER